MPKLFNRSALIGLLSGAAVLAGAAAMSISPAVGATSDNLVVRYGDAVTVPSSGPINRQATAYCMSWEKVSGGGAAVTTSPGGTGRGEYFTSIVRNAPLPESLANGQTASGWLAEATNNSAHLAGSGESSVLRAYVICAS